MTKPYPYHIAVFLIGAVLFVWANMQVTNLPRKRIEADMQFAMPPAVQLLTTGGDRYLAANIGAFRAVTVGVFQLQPETYKVLAEVQLSAGRLNPYHEDNYYTAAAILAWNDQLDAAQEVLRMAIAVRTNDALPPFFHGFNQYYFYGDFNAAAKDLLLAADRTDGNNRIALKAIAAKWFDRGHNPKVAIDLLQKLAAQIKDRQFKQLLLNRAARLEGLVVLQGAAEAYTQKLGAAPATLEALVSSGYLAALPADPLGLGYVLDASGKPVLAPPAKK